MNEEKHRENWQFLYSAILIVVIPILIIANISWQIYAYRKNINAEIEQKTNLAGRLVAKAFTDLENSPNDAQARVDSLLRENKDIREITLYKKEPGGFLALASSANSNIGLVAKANDLTEVWLEGKPKIAVLEDNNSLNQERIWSTTVILKDANEAKIGLAQIKMSSLEIDTLTQKALTQSIYFLTGTIVLVLLLLLNIFRLFEYAVALRRLKEEDKAKDDFISMASHELKTPMAAIKGYLEMLLEGLIGKFDDKVKDHLLKISDGVKRLDTLVSELLDVSRLDQGRMKFDFQPIDVRNLTHTVMASFASAANEKRLGLDEEAPVEVLPPAFVDEERLKQVLENIIGNSLKYTKKGGVKISYALDRDKLEIAIKDTGIGMNEKDQKRLFEKFYRVKNEQTVDIAGTGLGLWIAKEMVSRMKGNIRVESKENVGSTFTVSVPFVKL